MITPVQDEETVEGEINIDGDLLNASSAALDSVSVRINYCVRCTSRGEAHPKAYRVGVSCS